MQVPWITLKAFIDQRALSVQWIDIGDSYWSKAFDGPFTLECVLPKDGGSDQTDFETNYKSNGNQSPKTNVVQQLGSDSFSVYTQGINFVATAGQATINDFQLSTTLYARGGTLCSFNVAAGDWITVDIIDKDNITGQGGTPDNPTVLDDYIPQWYVMPGQNLIEDISISAPIPSGLYFRITYHSVGVINTVIACNLLTYVKI